PLGLPSHCSNSRRCDIIDHPSDHRTNIAGLLRGRVLNCKCALASADATRRWVTERFDRIDFSLETLCLCFHTGQACFVAWSSDPYLRHKRPLSLRAGTPTSSSQGPQRPCLVVRQVPGTFGRGCW